MWAAAGILFLVVFVTGLAKLAAPYKKGTLKSLPWHSGHEVFWGCAKHLFKRVVRENALMHEDFLEQHRANGFKNFGFSIVGGKTEIVVCEPEDIKCILKDSYANFEKDKAFQHIFEELLGEGIFVVNGSQWKEQRVVASHFFNRRQLRDRMSHVFGHHAQHLVEVLERKAGQSVEIQAPLYHFTFDTINSVAFNRRVSSQGGNAADCAFETAFDAFTNCVVSRFLVPWWKLNRALQLTAEERTIKHSTKVLNDYVNNVVNEYVDEHGNVLPAAEVSDDQTLMDLYLQHALEEGKRYTRKFLRDMILNFVIAGRDTTASTLTSCIRFLTEPENEHWQGRLAAEAAKCFGDRADEPLSFNDVEGKSPAAEAVLLEALRLNPAVPGTEKVCVKDTTLPSGVTVPAGVHVHWCQMSTNRMPGVYGGDAEIFRPGRWLTDDNTVTTRYDDYSYPTFNAGPRLCLGKSMAILEGKIGLLTLFSRLRFTRTYPDREVRPCSSVTWQLKPGFEVTVHRK